MTFVFGDISGTEESGVIVAACYLGRESHWETATNAWSRTLLDAGVDVFHATEFYNGRGRFKATEWDPKGPKHLEFARRFCSIADNAGLVGFVSAMDYRAFNSILVPELRREKRNHRTEHPRTYCTFKAANQVAAFLERANHDIRQRVHLIFEHEQGAGRFVDFFVESQKRREKWTKWFESFTTAEKALVPLQIADLLAHEGWRRAKAILTDPEADTRQSFDRMLLHKRIEFAMADEASCRRNAPLIREILERFPDGLVPPASEDG